MKTISTLLQILALIACFTAQVHGAFAMPGVRRALQTMDGGSGQSMFAAASAYTVSLAAKPAMS